LFKDIVRSNVCAASSGLLAGSHGSEPMVHGMAAEPVPGGRLELAADQPVLPSIHPHGTCVHGREARIADLVDLIVSSQSRAAGM